MTEDELKDLIEDVIEDMVRAGELEAGDNFEAEEEDEEEDIDIDMEDEEEMVAERAYYGKNKGDKPRKSTAKEKDELLKEEEDTMDFCRTDGICVLSTEKDTSMAIGIAKKLIGKPYDYSFSSSNKKYYCTELVNICYNGLFNKDKIKTFGKSVLLPDGIFNSKEIKFKIEFKH